jgi:predicted anti-sigma-YlaC factor YlaD
MNKEHQDCHEMLQTLSDYVDGELDPVLCAELQRHMSECKNCRVVVDTLQKTIELYQVVEEEERPLPTDVRNRLFLRLNMDEFCKEA